MEQPRPYVGSTTVNDVTADGVTVKVSKPSATFADFQSVYVKFGDDATVYPPMTIGTDWLSVDDRLHVLAAIGRAITEQAEDLIEQAKAPVRSIDEAFAVADSETTRLATTS